jgi:hypothetical protein
MTEAQRAQRPGPLNSSKFAALHMSPFVIWPSFTVGGIRSARRIY